ncbi:hypothetical protein [Pseudoalteromonas sp. MTN2-4]|uniref:hypothetical protein n=1 Tax=Pseudoalteromonas sp. MTN2-4 TaxID=3056555 RepID=UPI0036F2EB0F
MTDNTNPETQVEELQTEQLDEIDEQMAAAMLKDLAEADNEQELDFDPTQYEGLDPEQAAIQQTADILMTEEGSAAMAADGLDMIEDMIREHVHPDFVIKDTSKKMGAARMKPLIQKYAPAAAGLLGNYKDEILGAVWLGSFMFSSVKQIKQLKARDAQAKKETEQVEQNEVASDVDATH